MGGSYNIPRPEDRLIARIAELETQVKELSTRPFIVPTLGQDAPATSLTNLWYLTDGRLRGRLVDGTIVEYARTGTLGGSTSTAAPPAPDPVPTEHTYRQAANWSQSYHLSSGAQRTDAGEFLYYGYISSTHGEQKSMLGWTGLPAILAGSRISSTQLRIVNRWTNYNSGADLRIGFHNSGAAPANFSETQWDPITKHVFKSGYESPPNGSVDQTYDLDASVGAMFRDGLIQGFTFDQHSTNSAFYGYSTKTVELIIKYITYS